MLLKLFVKVPCCFITTISLFPLQIISNPILSNSSFFNVKVKDSHSLIGEYDKLWRSIDTGVGDCYKRWLMTKVIFICYQAIITLPTVTLNLYIFIEVGLILNLIA